MVEVGALRVLVSRANVVGVRIGAVRGEPLLDRYETLHWRAVEEWLAANGSDPDADDVRSRHEHAKRAYLHHGRELLGWAIFIGWKPLATH